MSDFWSIAGAFSCALCTLVGVFGNGMTIALFLKFKKFRNPVGFFILSLALTDFLSSLTTTTGNTYFFINDMKWQTQYSWCVLYRVLTYGNFTASAFLIFMISVNRCVKICYSTETYKKIYRNRNIAGMIIVVIAVPYALEILAAMNIGGHLIHKVELGICSLKHNDVLWAGQLAVYFVMTFIAIICYSKIYIKQAKARDILREPRRDHTNQRVLIMLVVTSLAYACCFVVPLVFGFISKQLGNRQKMPEEHFVYKVVSSVGIIINPIIYVVLNKQYRAAYTSVLLCKDLKKKQHTDVVHSSQDRYYHNTE